jgi:putative serine protease PepD
MLLVGIAAGSAVTAVVARGQGSTSGVATIKESTTAPPATATGDAENVAHDLAAAVGTVVARGSSSSALGSGFVISHDDKVSYALTNNHVVDGAKDLFLLMPDGHNLKATLVGTDTLDDLAVISVANTGLPVATFGDSSQLKVGQAVIAIGSPLGNEGSVTRGVVSALHRTITAGSSGSAQSEVLQDVLQTDASINQGNSGGPLADASARVVGVNVAIAGGASNIGFSIPSNLARGVAETLMRHQKVQHPYLGVKYLTTIEAFEENRGFDGAGVLIDTVSAGSPAEKAGFHTNDILEAVNGVTIDNGETLGGLIQGLHVGDSVAFTVRRGDQHLHLTATLVDRPAKV